MKRYLTLLFATLGILTTMHSQSFDWAIQSTQLEYGYGNIEASVTDNDGNTISTGSFNYNTDFDPSSTTDYVLSTTGMSDIFIWKTSPTGALVWAKQISGPLNQLVYDIAQDSDGNIYLTGTFDGTADFDPSNGTSELSASGGQGAGDIFIAKYNTSGDLVWAQRIGASSNQIGYGITVSNEGSVYITGQFFGSNIDFNPGAGTSYLDATYASTDLFLLKLNTDGGFIWVKKINDNNNNDSHEFGQSVITDASGNIYLYGWYTSTLQVDFDPGAGTFNMTPVAGVSNRFILKLDNSGNFSWAKQLDPKIELSNEAITIDNVGNLVIGGFFTETADFDPGTSTSNLTSNGAADLFVSKWNSSGNVQWTKQIGSTEYDFVTSLVTDDSNMIYMTGGYSQTVDFDPGVGVANMSSNSGAFHTFLCKLNATGDYNWAIDFEGINTYSQGNSIQLDAANNIVVSGIFTGTIDFDISPITESTLTALQLEDIFIVKINNCAELSALGTISGDNTVCSDESYTYNIPNNVDADSYTWSVPSGWIGNSTTNSITVTAGTSNGTISVVANNSCGSSPASNLQVSVTSINGSITTNNNILTANESNATYQWLNCSNNQSISGQTSQTFTPTSNGSYACTITKNGCTVTTDCISVTTIDISNAEITKPVSIYPNPTNGNLTIQSDISLTRFQVMDTQGRLIESSHYINTSQILLDLSRLPIGVYYLETENENGSMFRSKIMKTI